MPHEEDIYNFDDDNDNNIEEDDLFYQANRTDDYLCNDVDFDTPEIGDQSIWKEHSSKGCKISINGGQRKVWNEARDEIRSILVNIKKLQYLSTIIIL